MLRHEESEAHRAISVFAALLLVGFPLAGTYYATFEHAEEKRIAVGAIGTLASGPPRIEPVSIRRLTVDEARKINGSVPFSRLLNVPSRPFRFAGTERDRARAVDCLAAAQYYEAGDDKTGQEAVAQVVLNRVRHPAFPKSVCGVVFEGAERASGCQFTFTCDGSLARAPPPSAWERARNLARLMISGQVERKVGLATHYHTDWVVPYWSASLDKVTKIGTHLFFRWPGWWGQPRVFMGSITTSEPTEPLLASISRAHEVPNERTLTMLNNGQIAPQMTLNATELAALPPKFKSGGPGDIIFSPGVHVISVSPSGNSFIIALSGIRPDRDYAAIAQALCAGRGKCRIMGWPADEPPPANFPVPAAALPSMVFSYIHDVSNGLQRLLWNCVVLPQQDPRNCMRRRVRGEDFSSLSDARAGTQ